MFSDSSLELFVFAFLFGMEVVGDELDFLLDEDLALAQLVLVGVAGGVLVVEVEEVWGLFEALLHLGLLLKMFIIRENGQKIR